MYKRLSQHTPTPCILHKYSCVLTDILYEFVYLVLRYTTGMALLKIEYKTLLKQLVD